MIGGIAGYFQRQNEFDNEADQIAKLDNGIHLLGPQSSAYQTAKITDTILFSRMILPLYGPQPEDLFFPIIEGCTIVASGLIINKKKLSQLLGLNTDEDDALFILKAYLHWGTTCLDYLEGKFSFVIWDQKNQHIFCAKGPTGMTDLVYYLDADRFVFATEIKSVLAQLPHKPAINPLFIVEHLENFVSERKGTTYQGIFHVLPAHAMLITKDTVKEWCYWEPGKSALIRLPSDEAYVEKAQSLFEEVMAGYVDSGLKIGLQTSGGLNTSLIAATLSSLSQTPISGVSYCLPTDYTGDLIDEKAYTDLLVKHVGMDIHYVNESVFPDPYDEDIELKMKQQDSQIVNPVGSDHYVVFGKMRELEVQLCITTGFKSMDWTGTDVLVDFIAQGKIIEARNFNRRFLKQSALKNILFPLFPNVINILRRLKRVEKNTSKKPLLTNKSLVHQLNLKQQKDRSIKLITGRYADYGFQHDQLNSIKKRLVNSRKYISAQEYRYNFVMVNPMQDRRLIDFALSIPRKQHILDGQGRSLLRRMLLNKVPEIIYEKPSKCSYPADMRDRWLNAKPHVFSHLEAIPDESKVWDYIDRSNVISLVEKVKKSSDYAVWLKNRDRLNKVILLDRFLRF